MNALSGLGVVTRFLRSPIEEKFLVGLTQVGAKWSEWVYLPDAMVLVADGKRFPLCGDVGVVRELDEITVKPQASVGSYHADFLLQWRQWGVEASVAVELDGHEFHEKTKEQAARDRRRDRYFTVHGLSPMRFAGSEIHRNATDCAIEAVAELYRRFGEEMERDFYGCPPSRFGARRKPAPPRKPANQALVDRRLDELALLRQRRRQRLTQKAGVQ